MDLDDKRPDWLYEHFQSISVAADRYLAAFGFVVTFSLVMFLAPNDVFTIPVIGLSVGADILLAGLCGLGGFLFIAFAGNYDKGEATLLELASVLRCDYGDLWFVDTHPTIVDFAQFSRHASTRIWFDRLISALLYPVLLGTGLSWLTVVPVIRFFTGPLRGIHYGLYAVALSVLYFAWRRAGGFIGRRWRTFKESEADRVAINRAPASGAKKYYRVLATSEHHDHFQRQARNSFWGSPPGEWESAWTRHQSGQPGDYDLVAAGRLYTPAALVAFIRFKLAHSDGSRWSNEEMLAASELNGLCAFNTPQLALEYAERNPYWRVDQDRYLVLTGRPSGQCAEPGSTILQDWKLEDGPLTRKAFSSKYADI